MTVNPMAMKIRAKKLGVLIRDARLAAYREADQCARAIGVSTQDFQAFELGEKSPSLPELELLAFYLDIPLDHFWGNRSRSEEPSSYEHLDLDRLKGLRRRVIGTKLRQARANAGLSLEKLSEQTGLSDQELEAIELNQKDIPLPMLEALCGLVDHPIKDFIDVDGPVGAWDKQQRATQEFLLLSPEMQAFVSKPVNRPYLDLAQRLSEMSVDRLRAVAEVLLEITL